VSGLAQCPPASPNERRTLDRIGAASDVRLACQLRPVAAIGVVPLLDATATAQPGRDAPPPTVEREIAVLLVDLRGWVGPGPVHSSHDEVYASNLALVAIGDAIVTAGGVCTRCDAEGAVAAFGLAIDVASACRQAFDAARNIEREIEALNARLIDGFGFTADVVLVVHSGQAAIGAIGYGSKRATSIVGPALHDARRLRSLAAMNGQRFMASDAALRRAGVAMEGITERTLDGDGQRTPFTYLAAASVQTGLPDEGATR
jgi:adenylate cyclase